MKRNKGLRHLPLLLAAVIAALFCFPAQQAVRAAASATPKPPASSKPPPTYSPGPLADGVAGGAPDGYVPFVEEDDPAAAEFSPPVPDGAGNFDTAEGFLSFTQTVDRTAATLLIRNIHTYFEELRNCEEAQRKLDEANEKLAQARLDMVMGKLTSLEVEVLALEAEIAAAEREKAELELLKVVVAVKSDTGHDLQKIGCRWEDFFLILKPEEITLAEMKEWAKAEGDKALTLTLEQGLLDIRIAYISITVCAKQLAAATQRQQDISLGVIMGRNTNEELKAAADVLRNSRAALMSAISGYSMLLYSLNDLCNGEIAEKAGVMTLFVGRDRPSAQQLAEAEAARAAREAEEANMTPEEKLKKQEEEKKKQEEEEKKKKEEEEAAEKAAEEERRKKKESETGSPQGGAISS